MGWRRPSTRGPRPPSAGVWAQNATLFVNEAGPLPDTLGLTQLIPNAYHQLVVVQSEGIVSVYLDRVLAVRTFDDLNAFNVDAVGASLALFGSDGCRVAFASPAVSIYNVRVYDFALDDASILELPRIDGVPQPAVEFGFDIDAAHPTGLENFQETGVNATVDSLRVAYGYGLNVTLGNFTYLDECLSYTMTAPILRTLESASALDDLDGIIANSSAAINAPVEFAADNVDGTIARVLRFGLSGQPVGLNLPIPASLVSSFHSLGYAVLVYAKFDTIANTSFPLFQTANTTKQGTPIIAQNGVYINNGQLQVYEPGTQLYPAVTGTSMQGVSAYTLTARTYHAILVSYDAVARLGSIYVDGAKVLSLQYATTQTDPTLLSTTNSLLFGGQMRLFGEDCGYAPLQGLGLPGVVSVARIRVFPFPVVDSEAASVSALQLTPSPTADFLFDPTVQLTSTDGQSTLAALGNLTYTTAQLFSTSGYNTSVLSFQNAVLAVNTSGLLTPVQYSVVAVVQVPGWGTAALANQPLMAFSNAAIQQLLSQAVASSLGPQASNASTAAAGSVNNTACALPSGLFVYGRQLLLTPVDAPQLNINGSVPGNGSYFAYGPESDSGTVFYTPGRHHRTKHWRRAAHLPIPTHPRAQAVGAGVTAAPVTDYIQVAFTRRMDGFYALYLNAVLVANGTATSEFVISNDALYFFQDGCGRSSSASLARLSFYPFALTGVQVSQLDVMPLLPQPAISFAFRHNLMDSATGTPNSPAPASQDAYDFATVKHSLTLTMRLLNQSAMPVLAPITAASPTPTPRYLSAEFTVLTTVVLPAVNSSLLVARIPVLSIAYRSTAAACLSSSVNVNGALPQYPPDALSLSLIADWRVNDTRAAVYYLQLNLPAQASSLSDFATMYGTSQYSAVIANAAPGDALDLTLSSTSSLRLSVHVNGRLVMTASAYQPPLFSTAGTQAVLILGSDACVAAANLVAIPALHNLPATTASAVKLGGLQLPPHLAALPLLRHPPVDASSSTPQSTALSSHHGQIAAVASRRGRRGAKASHLSERVGALALSQIAGTAQLLNGQAGGATHSTAVLNGAGPSFGFDNDLTTHFEVAAPSATDYAQWAVDLSVWAADGRLSIERGIRGAGQSPAALQHGERGGVLRPGGLHGGEPG